ncbi:hypothetical protein [Rubellicoccus peritrichatus]|uniref:Uncharacterized protein n=1 Tax=Rubellicoccus peritrichatus TaxID=3080537 RepID=A0AAQ3LCQ3_9BACT|nr:hypothetical protein [Puniceicoccus sp. CR14]WOO42052.1 hypothetical protein RZN69_03060 [Puniceicoccus sp. CR14]
MSLINQALKKRQRGGDPAPVEQPVRPQPEPTAFRPTHAETQPGYQLLYWVVGGGILIAGIVAAVALTIVLMSPKPQAVQVPEEEPLGVRVTLQAPAAEVPVVQNPQPAPVVQSNPAPPAPQTTAQVESPVQTTVNETAAVAPTPTAAPKTPEAAPPSPPAPTPTVVAASEAPPSTPVSSPEPAATSKPPQVSQQPVKIGKAEDEKPEPPPPDEPIPGAEPDPKVLAFLESSRITGIKVAGKQSRVLMNNQVFKTDSIVQPETKLRITEIQPNEILFVDESGIQYRKQFQR